MIRISLHSDDRRWATEIGKARWTYSKKIKSKPRFADAKEEHHIIGAGGELAFCRALRLPWPASNRTYKSEPDVPPRWEVRTSPGMRGVKVTPEDDDDALVVWVAGKMPVFEIMGYIRAGGAKRHPEWFVDPGSRKRSIYLVPPNRMIEIEPGFHSAHAFMQDLWGDWFCALCGAESKDEVA